MDAFVDFRLVSGRNEKVSIRMPLIPSKKYRKDNVM